MQFLSSLSKYFSKSFPIYFSKIQTFSCSPASFPSAPSKSELIKTVMGDTPAYLPSTLSESFSHIFHIYQNIHMPSKISTRLCLLFLLFCVPFLWFSAWGRNVHLSRLRLNTVSPAKVFSDIPAVIRQIFLYTHITLFIWIIICDLFHEKKKNHPLRVIHPCLTGTQAQQERFNTCLLNKWTDDGQVDE